MSGLKRSSSAEVTPPTPQAAVAIREELRRTHDDLQEEITATRDGAELADKAIIHQLNQALLPLTDAVNGIETAVARIVAGEARRLRREQADATERTRIATNTAILLARRDAKRDTAAVDNKVNILDLKVDALSLNIGADLQRTETALQRLAKPVGYSAGGAGIVYVLQYLGPLLNPLLKDAFASVFGG